MTKLDEALERFTLVKGSAGDGEKTACLTSLWNWASGEPTWGDTLQCANPLIRSLAINFNDGPSTLDEMLEIARLGENGAIDTWWIPTEVVLSYYGDFTREETPTQFERLVKMLTGVAAWKIDKVRRNLDRANLDGASLIGANLDGASLKGANLDGANLIEANLYRANLDGANLYGAHLNGANLIGANLIGANLYGAHLNGANLIEANLIGANLYGAHLDGASLNRVRYFGDALHLDKTVGEPASLPDGWEYKNGLIVRKA